MAAVATIYLDNYDGKVLRTSVRDSGFFILRRHGLEELLEDVHYATQEFFALPEHVKREIDKANSSKFMGWEQVGSERTQGMIDYREQLDLMSENDQAQLELGSPIWTSLEGQNQWPDEEYIPGFRDLMQHYMFKAKALSEELLDVMMKPFGDGYWPRSDQPDHSLLKLIRYPGNPQFAGVNAHKDFGFLTLVPQFGTSGLQAEISTPWGKRWEAIDSQPYTFAVNVGEIMQAITDGYYLACTHRVMTKEPRLSSAFFYGPHLDYKIETLYRGSITVRNDRRDGDGFMATLNDLNNGRSGTSVASAPKTYGEMLWRYYERSYPELMQKHYGDALTHSTT